jgi:hypothetical protein
MGCVFVPMPQRQPEFYRLFCCPFASRRNLKRHSPQFHTITAFATSFQPTTGMGDQTSWTRSRFGIDSPSRRRRAAMDTGLVQTELGPRTDGAPHGRRILPAKKIQNGVLRNSKIWCTGRNKTLTSNRPTLPTSI